VIGGPTTRLLLAPLVLLGGASAAEEASGPAPEPHVPEIRRWLEFPALSVLTRYHFVENSASVVTASQWQYKDVLQARLNFDRAKRYTLNVGLFTGANFISTWNNTGVGKGTPDEFVASHYLKQLYVSAVPVSGIELQYGGIYVVRGEGTEWTTYDDDGYAVGERLSVKRRELFFEEISLTRALIGPYDTPDLTKRWNGLHDANYYQVLLAKRAGRHLRASADWTRDQGTTVIRAAMAATFGEGAPVRALRYEQYWRASGDQAFGFAIWLERPVTTHARLQAGYATIDELYGGWNADRIQKGRRLFAIASLPIHRELSASLYATRAFSSSYPVSNQTRFDAILVYDLAEALRRIGWF
jgi:hypothetical protein